MRPAVRIAICDDAPQDAAHAEALAIGRMMHSIARKGGTPPSFSLF